jgi:addiction module HigA family antidote
MHPGEVLREEFLVPLEMSADALAKVCGLPRKRIERIAGEQTGITADTALRFAKALGTTAQLCGREACNSVKQIVCPKGILCSVRQSRCLNR